jgi:hypothetical protein
MTCPQKVFDAVLLKLLIAFKYNKEGNRIQRGFPTHSKRFSYPFKEVFLPFNEYILLTPFNEVYRPLKEE